MKTLPLRFTERALRVVLLGFIATALLSSASAQVHHYYISPNGSDSNDGSQARPWKTVAHANGSISLGSSGTCAADSDWFSETAAACIHLMSGTYNTSGVTLSNGGASESQRVVYVADAKWGAVFLEGGSTVADFFLTGDYLTLAGIDVSSATGSTKQVNLYVLESNGAHNHFIGNRVHDGALGPCTGQGGAGIADLDDATDTTVSGNWVFNMGPGGASTPGNCRTVRGIYMARKSTITNNVVFNNSENGIAVTHNSSNSVISGNTVFNNGGYGTGLNGWSDGSGSTTATCCAPGGALNGLGDGITIAADPGVTQSNVVVTNNIVYNNGAANGKSTSSQTCGILLGRQGGSVTGAMVSNNLVVNTTTGNPKVSGGIPCGSNFAPVQGFGNNGNTITGTIVSNPQFVNYQPNGSGDYHLASGSPAVWVGTTQGSAKVDFESAPRHSPPSLGAFEFVTTNAGDGPAAPSGLTAVVQ